MHKRWKELLADESGTIVIEYGLIISLVVIGIIGLIVAIGGRVHGLFASLMPGFS